MDRLNLTIILLLAFFCILMGCHVPANTQTTEKAISKPVTKVNFVNHLDSTLLLNDVKYLADDKLEGRETGTKGAEMARDFMIKRMKKLGLENVNGSYEQSFTFKTRKGDLTGINVMGKLTGTKHPEKYFVITAHYDHLGIHDGKIFNGADDNASGVAAVLAAAAFFKKNPPKHSILFVGFDAEEKGLRGANVFVKKCPVNLDNVVLNVNLDMISRNEKDELYFCGTHHYPILKEKLAGIQQKTYINVKYGHDLPNTGSDNWTHSSDHAPFHKKGIPFLYLGVEDHADYHKHTDDFDKIDPQFLFYSANLVIEVIQAFDL